MNILEETKQLANMVESEDDWYDLKKQANLVLDLIDNKTLEQQGRKQALEEVYQEVKDLFTYRIRTHNHDFDNAKDEKYKYDLSRDAREFNANFNMVLDIIKEKMESEE